MPLGLQSTTKGISVATKELTRDHGVLAQLLWLAVVGTNPG